MCQRGPRDDADPYTDDRDGGKDGGRDEGDRKRSRADVDARGILNEVRAERQVRVVNMGERGVRVVNMGELDTRVVNMGEMIAGDNSDYGWIGSRGRVVMMGECV